MIFLYRLFNKILPTGPFSSREGAFAYFLGIFILALPYYMRVTTPLETRLSKDFFFTGMIFFSLILFGMDSSRIPKIPSVIFFIISFLSFFNQYDQYSFRVINHWLFLNAGMILFLQASSLINENTIKIVLNFMAVSLLIQSAWITANYFNIEPYRHLLPHIIPDVKFLDPGTMTEIPKDRAARIAGSLHNSNLAGWFLAMGTPCLLRKWWHLGLIPVVIATLITDCAAGIISLLGILFIYALSFKLSIKKSALIFSSLFLVAGGTLVSVKPQKFLSDNERYHIWGKSYEWVKKDLKKGVGLGLYGDYFAFTHQKEIKQHFTQAHNEYLETLIAFGYIGLSMLAALGIHVWIILDQSKIIPFLGIVAGAINSIVGFPFHISSTALLFIIFSAIMFRRDDYGIRTGKNRGRSYRWPQTHPF